MKKFFNAFGYVAAALLGAGTVAMFTTEKGRTIARSISDGSKNLWVKITQKNQEVNNQE